MLAPPATAPPTPVPPVLMFAALVPLLPAFPGKRETTSPGVTANVATTRCAIPPLPPALSPSDPP